MDKSKKQLVLTELGAIRFIQKTQSNWFLKGDDLILATDANTDRVYV